jgi:hypothetical protein
MLGPDPSIPARSILHERVGSHPIPTLAAAQSPHPFTFLSCRAYIDVRAGFVPHVKAEVRRV